METKASKGTDFRANSLIKSLMKSLFIGFFLRLKVLFLSILSRLFSFLGNRFIACVLNLSN